MPSGMTETLRLPSSTEANTLGTATEAEVSSVVIVAWSFWVKNSIVWTALLLKTVRNVKWA